MKDHHEYPKKPLGGSDIASLMLRAPGELYELHMGEDGEYSAYVVDGEALIPEWYTQAFECEGWLWVFDDDRRTARFTGKLIRVFRSGDFGIIVQILNEEDANAI